MAKSLLLENPKLCRIITRSSMALCTHSGTPESDCASHFSAVDMALTKWDDSILAMEELEVDELEVGKLEVGVLVGCKALRGSQAVY